ncbi:MAG TPA: hypothetical protein VHM00_03425 [Caldimonas sp.]|jgi:vacuolar-type H+-ATPase subunit D/Vma8|nr:hypothetical protein [Caldimonas sp.]HEX2540114.1 hypothetical protein [Caldimonas sp.]
MDIESLQAEAYADAKAALQACAEAAEQVLTAVVRLEEAQRALRRSNQTLAEVNRLCGAPVAAETAREAPALRLVSGQRSR